MTESEVQKAILDYLHLKKIYVQRVNSGSMFTSYNNKAGGKKTYKINLAEVGTPDLFVCVNGRFCGVEIKKDERTVKTWLRKIDTFKKESRITPYNQREVAQYKASLRINESGGVYILTYSLDDFINSLNQLEFKKKLKQDLPPL